MFGTLTIGDLEVAGFKNGYLPISCEPILVYSSPVGLFILEHACCYTRKKCLFASLLITLEVKPISTSAR